MKRQNKTRTLVECGILIALATVLSFIKVWKNPLGGSVTLFSTLPVCVVSIRHGTGWGFGTAFIYSLLQLMIGIAADGILGWGLTAGMLVGCILFDYIFAYTILGISGAFRYFGEGGIYAGIILAFLFRFASHFTSGYVIFTNLEQWNLFGQDFSSNPVLYSICYNGLFMLPELILTLIGTVILMRIPYVKRTVFKL